MKKSLLLESIRLQNGQLPYLSYHQTRLDQTRQALFRSSDRIDLAASIRIPAEKNTGLFKVRVLYRQQIEAIEIEPYSMRPVQALQLVVIDDLHYAFKFADRTALNQLVNQRTFGDDILMIRNGFLTDTSYANVALFDGDSWFTPAAPLLAGTARARLLAEKLLRPADIHYQDLSGFQELRLINAMMDWEEAPRVAMHKVGW